jgi:hypothetical protein
MYRIMATRSQHEAKTMLLNAAPNVIRAGGCAAMAVDDFRHAAGVTKGQHCGDTWGSSSTSNATPRERQFHEHEQCILGRLPWQQDQPANVCMERASGSGTARKGA